MEFNSSLQSTSIIAARNLSVDNKINIIIGVLTIVIAVLSTILGWATWRLTGDRVQWRGHHEIDLVRRQQEPGQYFEYVPLQAIDAANLGYELARRLERNFRN